MNDFSLYHRTQKKRKCEDDGATSNGKPTTTTENEVRVCVCVCVCVESLVCWWQAGPAVKKRKREEETSGTAAAEVVAGDGAAEGCVMNGVGEGESKNETTTRKHTEVYHILYYVCMCAIFTVWFSLRGGVWIADSFLTNLHSRSSSETLRMP